MSLLDSVPNDGAPHYLPTRGELQTHTRELAHTAPMRMRAVVGDDAWLAEYGEILKAGCRGSDRTCINAMKDLLKASGNEDLAASMLAMMGFATVQAGQRAAAAISLTQDKRETEREAIAWVQGERRLSGRAMLIDPEASGAAVEP